MGSAGETELQPMEEPEQLSAKDVHPLPSLSSGEQVPEEHGQFETLEKGDWVIARNHTTNVSKNYHPGSRGKFKRYKKKCTGEGSDKVLIKWKGNMIRHYTDRKNVRKMTLDESWRSTKRRGDFSQEKQEA